MTMQMTDTFFYQGEKAEAIAISHRFSFSPANAFGIETASWSTSTYRGFWCDYSIDESFVIQNLYLYSKNQFYPSINGQGAEKIPDFVALLDEINRKARVPKKYGDGFPMQYIGINYDYEYSGRIVLGIDPEQNKAGRKKYRKVIELLLDMGIVEEETDITEIWQTVDGRQTEKVMNYWWERQSNNYYILINTFMGVNEPRSE